MTNADIEWSSAKLGISKYLKTSPLSVFLRFAPAFAEKFFDFQVTERVLEYPFIHEEILTGVGKVLDVGSGNSTLPFEIAGKGYQVWSLDLKMGYCRFLQMNNLRFAQQDITNTCFPSEFFDIIMAVSTIEHVGLGIRSINFDGDFAAIKEMRRIIKPSGRLLITVPFGKAGYWPRKKEPTLRVYDKHTLYTLLDGFSVDKIKCGILDNNSWRLASIDEAGNIDSLSQQVWLCAKSVAMVVAKRL
jgi:SAM-dependent methyltransferase